MEGICVVRYLILRIWIRIPPTQHALKDLTINCLSLIFVMAYPVSVQLLPEENLTNICLTSLSRTDGIL
jgi:hypothetical protein